MLQCALYICIDLGSSAFAGLQGGTATEVAVQNCHESLVAALELQSEMDS